MLQEKSYNLFNKFDDQRIWEQSYNTWRGDDWPSCPDLNEIHLLPDWIKDELISQYNCSLFGVKRNVFTTKLKQFFVYYQTENDGGGTIFGQEYIEVLKTRYPKKVFNWCYEWCSGPGFIGYSILEHNLCHNLILTDMWAPAISDAEYTKNNLNIEIQKKINIHLLKDIALIPKKYKFDLIVGNPPHYKNNICVENNGNRICTDENWESHRNFFKNIKKNLASNGVILLQESVTGSTKEDFREMIEENKLIISDCFSFKNDQIYYIEIKHKGVAPYGGL